MRHGGIRLDPAESAEGGQGQLRLRLLGKFVLAREDGYVALPIGAQRLLAYLAIHGPAPRPVIIGALWPNVGAQQARGCLRTAIWRLNRDEPRLIRATDDTLMLQPDIAVDATAFTDSARRILQGSLSPGAEWAVLGARGDLLPGCNDDWVIFERERLRQLRLHALDALASWLAAQGRYGDALNAAMECTRLEPLRESAHRTIIAIYLADDNLTEALRHYESFRALLRTELGIRPSPQLAAIRSAAAPAAGR